ncbi:hypothetical protein R5N98_12515 [Tenacibaculum maritimum]|uniref:hypothetical protein n=1 Tax=Tenacibaculum maritimum TaxID=107401 RepID=UPI003890489D
MKIERSNILELIGTGKNKYHSCVITSYSIDLAFFEQLILPRLRAAGITNINLFVDAGMLEKYLSSHLGDSTKKFNANYSITPIHISGAFHPKMLFLAGKDKGYLSLGSGNITSSGLLYNDEIWSSFHTSKERINALPIFNSAWQYIQSLSAHCLGINQTKINWISQHSQWIQSLGDIKGSAAIIKDTAYQLSYTQDNISLYKEVISTLSRKPNSIKVVAPYYNKSGAFLKELISDLEPINIHCIVDTSNGILPVDFKSNLCQFSNWSDVIKSENSKSIQRLHAKMIQIEYDDETILILGSANATLEAYGISNRNFKNEEAVIVLKTEKTTDFLSELGIKIPEKGTLDIQKTKSIDSENFDSLKGLLKLKYVELSDQSLKIKLDKDYTESLFLRTFDSASELLEEIKVLPDSKTIHTSLSKTEDVFKLALFDSTTFERVSTFGLIQNIKPLKKSNPDERLARLQSFENLDIFSDLNYELIIDFLDQEQIFKDSKNAQAPTLASSKMLEDDAEVISESEYNKNANITLDEQVTPGNITSMVEEFLDVLKIRDIQEELSTNSEEMAIDAGDDGLDTDTTLQNKEHTISSKEGKRITKKISKTTKSVTSLIQNRVERGVPQDARTLNALFIGFHILLHFWDKVYSEEISEVKIFYKKIDELKKLEKQFKLERLKTQINSSNNEVCYNIDYTNLNLFTAFIKNNKEAFKIVGSPSEPITKDYNYIVDKYVINYTKNNNSFDFIELGLTTILSSIKKKEISINDLQILKILSLSMKLINKLIWNSKFNFWSELILLNLFEVADLESLVNENKILNIEILNSNFTKNYLLFKEKINNNLVERHSINSQIIGSIVYSSTIGFGSVRRILKNDFIEFYSPIISNDLKEDQYGTYKEVFISRQVKIFN